MYKEHLLARLPLTEQLHPGWSSLEYCPMCQASMSASSAAATTIEYDCSRQINREHSPPTAFIMLHRTARATAASMLASSIKRREAGDGDEREPLLASYSMRDRQSPASPRQEGQGTNEGWYCGIDIQDPDIGSRGLISCHDLLNAHVDDAVTYLKQQGVRKLGEIGLVSAGTAFRLEIHCSTICTNHDSID